jgi:hypothetical protein
VLPVPSLDPLTVAWQHLTTKTLWPRNYQSCFAKTARRHMTALKDQRSSFISQCRRLVCLLGGSSTMCHQLLWAYPLSRSWMLRLIVEFRSGRQEAGAELADRARQDRSSHDRRHPGSGRGGTLFRRPCTECG